MEATASKVYETLGKVDILINNAGIVNPLVPSVKMKKEDFNKVIDINLKGTFYTTQIFGKRMMQQGSGRIISIASQVALFGEKGFLPYAISKSGAYDNDPSARIRMVKIRRDALCSSARFYKGRHE